MSFNQLPFELRLDIWNLCLASAEDRYLILGVSLGIAMSHNPRSAFVEQIVVGGSFVPAWPDHALPVHPVESQLTIQGLGALCSESRAVVLQHYPDLVRLEKNTWVLGNCWQLAHGYEAWEKAGCRAQRFYLRCNLKTDILWAHSAAPARRFHSHRPVNYALGVYELIKDVPWGPVNADVFRQTLKSIRHAVVSMPLSVGENDLAPHTPRIQELLAGMSTLDTLSIQVGRFPEPFKRIKTPGPSPGPGQDSIPDVTLLYRPLSHRFLSSRYHNIPSSRFYTAVRQFKRRGIAEHSPEFYLSLDQRLRTEGLRFAEPSMTILKLRKKPTEQEEVEKWLREKKHFDKRIVGDGSLPDGRECDGMSLYLPDQFTMVASDEEIEADSREKNKGTWVVR
ncbi:hypothetical protein CEP54_003993 [Fusarium duplospermum]|uniref:2EXR domain-containing protein n=1 Tax=Fusarium duplospermum TaxID=1325734 RepID=A0A428QKN0_9HYPO|nr:hypothetical protein CEP54_003993 [Fusarium duplospermum]